MTLVHPTSAFPKVRLALRGGSSGPPPTPCAPGDGSRRCLPSLRFVAREPSTASKPSVDTASTPNTYPVGVSWREHVLHALM
jgi:hypothetical protein